MQCTHDVVDVNVDVGQRPDRSRNQITFLDKIVRFVCEDRIYLNYLWMHEIPW